MYWTIKDGKLTEAKDGDPIVASIGVWNKSGTEISQSDPFFSSLLEEELRLLLQATNQRPTASGVMALLEARDAARDETALRRLLDMAFVALTMQKLEIDAYCSQFGPLP